MMRDCVNIALGVVVGILIATNSEKAHAMVDKGKKAIKDQVNKM